MIEKVRRQRQTRRRRRSNWTGTGVHHLLLVWLFAASGPFYGTHIGRNNDIECGDSGSTESIQIFGFGTRRSSLFACAIQPDANVATDEPEVVAVKKPDKEIDPSPTEKSTSSYSRRQTLSQIIIKAGQRGLGGGIPGALAGVIQVLTLMWLRTIINYQSRYGMRFVQALRTLLNEGGIRRLYRGVGFAIIQAPLARFVSTAANDGVESLLGNLEWTREWGPGRTTVVASIVVGMWRILLMPIDTMKVVLQVDSTEGFRNLLRRVKTGKIGLLYQGSFATAVSAVMGHYPWFFTYNWLSTSEWVHQLLPTKLLRNAGIGLASSVVSDVVVNAVRVIKTTKQSLGSRHAVSYSEAIRLVLAADGWKGLFGRGLSTRIYANALQSIVFTLIWRGLAERWRKKPVSSENTENK